MNYLLNPLAFAVAMALALEAVVASGQLRWGG